MIVPALADRIVALAKDGKPPRVIREELGNRFSTASITNVIVKARKLDDTIPRFRAKNGARADQRTVLISTEALERLRPHARRRNLEVNELIRRLVTEILDDGLVDAVLDDGRGRS
jgi:hypothetical protein